MRVSEWRRLRTAGETSGVRAGEASELLGSRTSARTSGNFWELLGSDQVSSPFRSPEPTQLENWSDPISPTGFREPVSGQDYAVSRASLADCRVSRFREETHQVRPVPSITSWRLLSVKKFKPNTAVISSCGRVWGWLANFATTTNGPTSVPVFRSTSCT